ncbi:hypothetical protein Hypma_015335 [Hypsizygus marmoreus]|uniref:Uncharacterized protein n=1 Tax=Hypsizygus marmoreus TaxID=39966 RepID=A0A369K7Q5_HYPMA|nr:hypothetical protein Hypma_015335 [Hypsizygus marmoreus]
MDESTPLLASESDIPSNPEYLPSISHVVARISTLDAEQIRFEDLRPDGSPIGHHPTEIAFALVVLLQLRKTRLRSSQSSNIYETWISRKADAHDADSLEKRITSIWQLFLAEYRDIGDIEAVLWTRFPVVDEGEDSRRVLDFLGDTKCNTSLTSHPLVISSLRHTWKYGRSMNFRFASNHTLNWLSRYDALSTPRTFHLIEWISHLLFLAFLVNYLLLPIKQPHISGDWLEYQYGSRELFLIVLSLSFLLRPRSLVNTSSVIVPFAFLSSLPSIPHPPNTGFSILQWAAFLHVLGLNLPQSPSHLFLLSHHHTLPLAVLLTQRIRWTIFPAILFFLPLFIIASYLLSLSLFETFLKTIVGEMHSTILDPPPMETRVTFLCLFFTVVALILLSIFILATSVPLLSHKEFASDRWDQYSHQVGQAARQTFIRTVVSDSGTYTFPPPFNILHLVFFRIPCFFGHLFDIPISILDSGERILWRITVGPIAVLFTFVIWNPIEYLFSKMSTSH